MSRVGALEKRGKNTDAKKSELIKHNVHGGFKKDIHDLFSRDLELKKEIAIQLLNAHFPTSMHQDILEAVGLDFIVARNKRDPQFRERVLRAYEYRCAVCGLDMRLDNMTLGLDAAHIKWHQAGGPEREENGLALCVLHHRIFDRGAFTLDVGGYILVSQSISGSAGVEEWLLRYHKRSIREPQSKAYFPNPKFVFWHHEEVFRKPARD